MAKNNKTVANVPNMRFPGFSGDWETNKMGDLMTFKVTNSFSRDNLNYENGTVKNIHYGDIHTKFQTLFSITNESVPYINEEINIDRISDENYCKEGDLVFADASEDLNDVGKSIEVLNINNEKLLAGLHTLLARPKQNIFSLGFNGYLFKSNVVRKQIQKESQGSKVLSINVGRISKIKLSFPYIEEQKRIVSFLSLVDSRINTQNKIIQSLESLMFGLVQDIFTQKLRFKNDDGNEFPEWELMKLGNVSDVRDGTHDSPKYRKEGFPLVTSKNLTKYGEILFDEVNLISKEDYETFNKRSKVNIGDILFGMIGTIGNPVIVNCEGFSIKNVALIKQKESLLNSFLIYVLNSEIISKQFHLLNTGGTQKFIALGVIRGLMIPTPSIEEQNKISNFLSSINKKIEKEKVLLKEYEQQKKYLLQNLFI